MNEKQIRRTGWVNHKVANPESVSDHMYRMAMISWVFGDQMNINSNKLIKMALVHDAVEAIAGFIKSYFFLSFLFFFRFF